MSQTSLRLKRQSLLDRVTTAVGATVRVVDVAAAAADAAEAAAVLVVVVEAAAVPVVVAETLVELAVETRAEDVGNA